MAQLILDKHMATFEPHFFVVDMENVWKTMSFHRHQFLLLQICINISSVCFLQQQIHVGAFYTCIRVASDVMYESAGHDFTMSILGSKPEASS